MPRTDSARGRPPPLGPASASSVSSRRDTASGGAFRRWGPLAWDDPLDPEPEDPYTQDDLDSELPLRPPALRQAFRDALAPGRAGI